ncbi:MAG: ATP-binding protein [Armatimonadota bacterium]|nr:ATP-binding protein [Armatimonadota bacterium]MDR7449149.1 ATP-binding protein [Armatimonadota bacterium]MDR7480786.1 ATP-binding protein [Armatimonadota bacterium]MDR7489236.1 ATP-binding protein [Armatimonadota bacterium]MDR7492087.1 ATP-binding protein [Armatimonadota bacterium]
MADRPRAAPPPLTAVVELLLPAEAHVLRVVRSVLERLAEEAGFPVEQRFEAAVALSEAVAGVVRRGQTAWVTVRLAVDPTALRMEVEEQERHTRSVPPPVRLAAVEAGDGADELGVHLMRRLTDQVEVETAGAATRMRLVKLRRPAPPPTGRRTAPSAATLTHLRRTIGRYRRDLELMRGQAAPDPDDLDDLAILERFARSQDPEGLVADRMLRVKTLEATLQILEEDLPAPG